MSVTVTYFTRINIKELKGRKYLQNRLRIILRGISGNRSFNDRPSSKEEIRTVTIYRSESETYYFSDHFIWDQNW
jgi:hypothetical protein